MFIAGSHLTEAFAETRFRTNLPALQEAGVVGHKLELFNYIDKKICSKIHLSNKFQFRIRIKCKAQLRLSNSIKDFCNN